MLVGEAGGVRVVVGLPVGVPVGLAVGVVVGGGDFGDFFGFGLCGDRVGCGVGPCPVVGEGEGEAECLRPCACLRTDRPLTVGPDPGADLPGLTRIASLWQRLALQELASSRGEFCEETRNMVLVTATSKASAPIAVIERCLASTRSESYHSGGGVRRREPREGGRCPGREDPAGRPGGGGASAHGTVLARGGRPPSPPAPSRSGEVA